MMFTRVLHRVFVGILFVLFIGAATALVLKPELVDVAILRFDLMRAQDISQLPVIHPSAREIKETVVVKNARIVPEEDTELAFLFSGTIDQVVVKEGDIVAEGAVLASLETKELDLQIKQAEQKLRGAQARLLKLKHGTRKEEIAVSIEREKLSSTTISSAQSALYDVLRDTYTKVDDGFENKLESLISTNRGEEMKFIITLNNEQLEEQLKAKHVNMSELLSFWKKYNEHLAPDGNIAAQAQVVKNWLVLFSKFFDEIGQAMNALDGQDAATVSARRVVADLRTQMTLLTRSLTDAQSQLRNAEDTLDVATSERVLNEAPTESEDIRIAESEVEAALHQLSIVRDNMSHATIRAPYSGMVVKKVFHKRKEVVSGGEHIVLLAMPILKLHADIPEEDITMVPLGAVVAVSLKSYPGHIFMGKVVSIESNEIIKNESTYFRANIFFDNIPPDVFLRTGMTGDIAIETGHMVSAVFLPKHVLTYKDGHYSVAINQNGLLSLLPLAIGESDGQDIQVIGDISTQTKVLVEVQ